MKIVPLNDRILIEQNEAKGKTPGGIILPDVSKEKPREGKVLALGAGKLLDDGTRAAFSVKVGQTVLFTPYTGAKVTVEDKEYIIASEDEVLAIVG